eukprot:COSAG02_NODE_18988_length_906_cov_13.161090_2_plen_226_part_01
MAHRREGGVLRSWLARFALAATVATSSPRTAHAQTPFRYWQFDVTRDGTGGGHGEHICLNAFRFVQADGTYNVPTSVSSQQAGRTQCANDCAATLSRVFNVGDNPGADIAAPTWCGWGNPTITVEFDSAAAFVSYKFIPHSSPCTNDPQGWRIQASNDAAQWTIIAEESHDCPLPHLTSYNEYSLRSSHTCDSDGNAAWTLVRHTDGSCHTATDLLKGTDEYGTYG